MKMTGKDVVLFIINNDLLNVEVNDNLSGLFISSSEAAVKLGISTTSLEDMIKIGVIDHVKIDDIYYVSKNIDLKQLKRRGYE